MPSRSLTASWDTQLAAVPSLASSLSLAAPHYVALLRGTASDHAAATIAANER
jgi:hypothetical protein